MQWANTGLRENVAGEKKFFEKMKWKGRSRRRKPTICIYFGCLLVYYISILLLLLLLLLLFPLFHFFDAPLSMLSLLYLTYVVFSSICFVIFIHRSLFLSFHSQELLRERCRFVFDRDTLQHFVLFYLHFFSYYRFSLIVRVVFAILWMMALCICVHCACTFDVCNGLGVLAPLCAIHFHFLDSFVVVIVWKFIIKVEKFLQRFMRIDSQTTPFSYAKSTTQ